MQTIKHTIRFALIGIGIGTLLNHLFNIFLLKSHYSAAIPSFIRQFPSTIQAITVQLLIFALLGIIQGFASRLFQKEQFNLLTITIIHYSLIGFPLLLAGFSLHWFHMSWKSFLIFLLSISALYSLIYLFNYHTYKKTIQTINHRLKGLENSSSSVSTNHPSN